MHEFSKGGSEPNFYNKPSIESIDNYLYATTGYHHNDPYPPSTYITDNEYWHSLRSNDTLLRSALAPRLDPYAHHVGEVEFTGRNIVEHILSDPTNVNPDIFQDAVNSVLSNHDLANDGAITSPGGTMFDLVLANRTLELTENQKQFAINEVKESLRHALKRSEFNFESETANWVEMDHERGIALGARYLLVTHPSLSDQASELIPELYTKDEFDMLMTGLVQHVMEEYWANDDEPVIQRPEKVWTISEAEIEEFGRAGDIDSIKTDVSIIRNLMANRPGDWGDFDPQKYSVFMHPDNSYWYEG